jgi:thioredoxin 2
VVDELAARRGRRRLTVVLSAAAAVVLLVAAVIGVNWVGPNGWGAQREMAQLADAPDAQQVTQQIDGTEVTLIWSEAEQRSAIIAEGLPDVGDDRFDAAVVQSRLPVLVDIWAEWCAPCRAVAPIVERLALEHAGRLKVVKVDADRSPRISASHKVTAIPTLLFYQGGVERARLVGAPPAAQLREWVRTGLDGASSAA